MNNDQMKAGRFLKIQEGKRLFNRIVSHIKDGGAVYIYTHTRAIKITVKHKDMIRLGKSGSVYLQSGKRWDCVDYCGFKFSV